MSSSLKKLGLTVAAVLALAGGALVAAAPASARSAHGFHDNARAVLNAALAPSLTSYPSVFGLPPGGKDWTLQAGHAHLSANGRLEVNVTGLVLVATDSNPLPDIVASVYCDGSLVGTTPPVPFSRAGDAQIHAVVALPSPCLVPAVLLQPDTGSSVLPVYIAFDGTA
jgi:hypothetical protein